MTVARRRSSPVHDALSANMRETVTPWKFRVEGEQGSEIVREAGACKTPAAMGALLRREGLDSSPRTTWRAARERGELLGPTAKKRGSGARVPGPRDKRIADRPGYLEAPP